MRRDRRPGGLSLLVIASALLALAPTARAQSDDELLRAFYGLRRSGQFAEAELAMEQLLERLPKGERKKRLAGELADLYKARGSNEQALWLFRRNHDIPNEFETLFQMRRNEEALTLARLVRYPKGEAEALSRLGRTQEALRILQSRGMHKERGELLERLRRYEEAAAAFAAGNDFFRQGQALQRARKSDEARKAYEDAREGLLFDLRHERLPAVRQAKTTFDTAPDGSSRELARVALAKANGAAGDAYERLAQVYARTGRQEAPQLYENAARFLQAQRDALLDTAGGGDAYGRLLVEQGKLEARIQELRRLAAPRPGGR